MPQKVLFISEALSAPFDEGFKNVAFSIHTQLKMKKNVITVTKKSNITNKLDIKKIKFNKTFISNKLKKLIEEYSPDIILYLPEASITFNSFIRAKVLKCMNRMSKVVMLGVKQVKYSSFQRRIITNFLRPDLLLLLGRFDIEFFQKNGFKVGILPPAVDSMNFCQATNEEKEEIRAEFNLPINKKVVLHVGHLRSTRNVLSLLEMQRIDDIQVVVVGSSSTLTEIDLKERLTKEGVRVIDDFVPDIQKVYKMSDVYIFPVFNKIACIDMPLSVLEAMACNLPVITTRFGSLPDHFKEDAGFRYFDTIKELVKLVKLVRDNTAAKYHNNKKVEPFTWNRFADEIITACSESV